VDEPGSWRGAAAYEAYVGRWSRVVSRRFLNWLAVLAGSRWLDVGCGTGALTGEVLRCSSPAVVLGIDPSAPFVGRAAAQVGDRRAAFAGGPRRSSLSATCRWTRSSPGWCSTSCPTGRPP
jgi:trans-aconitate methyltransferase